MTNEFHDWRAHVDLMVRYAAALDGRDWTALANLFTHDAAFASKLLRAGKNPATLVSLSGRDAVVDGIRAFFTNLAASHHAVSNHSVVVAPDRLTARGSCYVRAYHKGLGERSHLFEESLARFDFDTARIGSEWTIRRIEQTIMIMLGTTDVFGLNG